MLEPATIELAADPAAREAQLEAVPETPAVFLVRLREGAPYLSRTHLLRRRLRRLLREPGGFPAG